MRKLFFAIVAFCFSANATQFENGTRQGLGTTWTGYRTAHLSGYSGVISPSSPLAGTVSYAATEAWGTYAFSASVDNYAEFNFQMPSDYELGTTITVYLDWTPSSAGAGDVVWVFAYRITDREAATGATTIAPNTLAADGTDNKIQQDQLTTFTGPDSLTKILSGYIQRDGNAGADNYPAVTHLIGVTLVYAINRAGT